MTMFKKTDPNPQLDIFTTPSMQLGSRVSKKYSALNAWFIMEILAAFPANSPAHNLLQRLFDEQVCRNGRKGCTSRQEGGKGRQSSES